MGEIKITNSLRRTAQRCGIKAPLKLSWDEIKDRLKICEKNASISRSMNMSTGRTNLSRGWMLQERRTTEKQRGQSWRLSSVSKSWQCGRGYKMLLDHLSKPNNIQSGGATMRPQSMHGTCLNYQSITTDLSVYCYGSCSTILCVDKKVLPECIVPSKYSA
jgi:hypothetical protein